MYVRRFALHDLDVSDGQLLDQSGRRFDRESYARFKYGHVPPAVTYGRGLARLIGDELFELAGTDPIRVVSAPYKHLPTASHGIARALVGALSREAVIRRGRDAPMLVPFFKSRLSDDGYARASHADRQRELARQGFRVDEMLIRGAHVLIVDDLRITGSAEQATGRFLEALAPEGTWYLHAARLAAGLGRSDPGLESEINQSVPHGAHDLLRDMSAGEFALNTRVLRHMLEYESDAEFSLILQRAPSRILHEMLDAALGSGIEYYRRHRERLTLLRDQIDRREGVPHHATSR